MIYRSPSRERAMALMAERAFGQALPMLVELLKKDPQDWGLHYMAGQCCRFTGDLDNAVQHLRTAATQVPADPDVLCALGIAHQLAGNLDAACARLEQAIEADPDSVTARNSLGVTLRKAGDLSGALAAYDGALSALARAIAQTLSNRPESPVLPQRPTQGERWVAVATRAALWIAAMNGSVERVVFPTGDQAQREEESQTHAGLYWVDTQNDEGTLDRLFLPNFFNTIQARLRSERAYSQVIGNTGTVLEELGRQGEAEEHFAEATEFSAE